MIFKTFLLACTAFAGTNIDDLFINMFFFSTADTSSKKTQLTLGKYLGMGFLTAASMLGAFGLQQFDTKYLSLMGLIPIALGIREIISAFKSTDDDETVSQQKGAMWLATALMTVANGADNIGVYLPLFSSFNAPQMLISAIVFAVLTGLSCLLADRLVNLPVIQKVLKKHQSKIVPAVYLLLGLYILFF